MASPAITGRPWPHWGPMPAAIRALLRLSCGTTCGDLNPTCHWAFEPISFGWPDRWPPVLAVPAFACFARPNLLREPNSVSGAFSCSAVHLRARRRREIYACHQKFRREIDKCEMSYPPTVASALCIIAWAVHNAVEKLADYFSPPPNRSLACVAADFACSIRS